MPVVTKNTMRLLKTHSELLNLLNKNYYISSCYVKNLIPYAAKKKLTVMH